MSLPSTCSIVFTATLAIVTGNYIWKLQWDLQDVLLILEMCSNTWQGWGMWTALIIIVWVLGFVIGEAVPFFADLLSLISSLFDSFFGLIFCKFLSFSYSCDLVMLLTQVLHRGLRIFDSQQG
jgi:hypothetical protein